MKYYSALLGFWLSILSVIALSTPAHAWQGERELRERATKAQSQGNYKDALEDFKALIDNKESDPTRLPSDIANAASCLQSLSKLSQLDALIEGAVETHPSNWRVLQQGANLYWYTQHYGSIVAGKFVRGSYEQKYMSSQERDRSRALQLLVQAASIAVPDSERKSTSSIYSLLAQILVRNDIRGQAWKLQTKTDLSELPDFEEQTYYYSNSEPAAPSTADGKPIFYSIPESFEAANSDGERYRWALEEQARINPFARQQIDYQFAEFLEQQFGTQTLASYSWFRPHSDTKSEKEATGGIFSLESLSDEETIARLASGVKRFTLPAEFNFIATYHRLAEASAPHNGYAQAAIEKLATLYENRRQYPKAAEYWQKAIAHAGSNKYQKDRLDQIVGAWGTYEPTESAAAKTKNSFPFRFRNATSVSFEAREILVPELLADVKSYLRSNPRDLDYEKIDISNIGYRIISKEQDKYLGKKVASWNLPLTPKKNHFDDVVTVETPLADAGAYWITAKVAGGNQSSIVLWINNTIILKKPIDDGAYIYVADAATGKPVPEIDLDFFGYRTESVSIPNVVQRVVGRNYNVIVNQHTAPTDSQGQLVIASGIVPSSYNWLITASNQSGRFAFLGFSGVWYQPLRESEYNQVRAFVITDRPVYRPKQTVKYHIWARTSKYDAEGPSEWEGRTLTTQIYNPRGDRVLQRAAIADRFGGVSGEFEIPADAPLGEFRIGIYEVGGNSSFRVEEYKKPEFEVVVDAPTEPAMLGDVVKASVTAKYYFGSPVTKAKVHYKILRTNLEASWFPWGSWDWLYGKGYWWFCGDYFWYPGWAQWGMRRPVAWWIHRPASPPEVVQESDAQLDANGKFPLVIDTTLAKEMHGNTDHKYQIEVQVTDESRRTIVGNGELLVARKPFQVNVWVDRGFYKTGNTVKASMMAQTLDNKPVKGRGTATLFKVTYSDGKPTEREVSSVRIESSEDGRAEVSFNAAEPGQYRSAFTLTDSASHTIEGGYLFSVVGEKNRDAKFRYNEIELIPSEREYSPGQNAEILVKANNPGATVLLFTRPSNGVYLRPKVLTLPEKSLKETIEISKRDMPNFFVEAVTIHNGEIHSEVKELVVPPEKKVINVAVDPITKTVKPGAEVEVSVSLTDLQGKPFVGSTVLSVYDRALEYISGGSNVPEIKGFFWKWRRQHYEAGESSLKPISYPLVTQGAPVMGNIGLFSSYLLGDLAETDSSETRVQSTRRRDSPMRGGRMAKSMSRQEGAMNALAPAAAANEMADSVGAKKESKDDASDSSENPGQSAPIALRKDFADLAFWSMPVTADAAGKATFKFKMPENLTDWKVKAWSMGDGTRVGEGSGAITTSKDLLLRLQAPRFFVEKDEVVLSANVHNYLPTTQKITVELALPGQELALIDPSTRSKTVELTSKAEVRVDWRVKVIREGEVTIRMTARGTDDSDGVEMKFPVHVHGMLKTDSFSGAVTGSAKSGVISMTVPAERRLEESRLEIRYSPSLALAMVDALPYLVSYPYGCTEQTLSRFLPTVITQRLLKDMNISLADIKEKRTNLNAQEIGDDTQRAAQWKGSRRGFGFDDNPVFDEAEVTKMVAVGINRLSNMQLSDGGWGWFSGYGEQSWPHTTAYVVQGLQQARALGLELPSGMLERGLSWLKNYQASQVQELKNAKTQTRPWKSEADALDAFVNLILVTASDSNAEMRDFLYRDRTKLPVYAKALLGLALSKEKQAEKLSMVLRNIEQFVENDDENQTAYLDLGPNNSWWYWYGSEIEANAYYLKLLAETEPKGVRASRLAKFLINNRKNATYWQSTRDTAIAIEALATYAKASGETTPNMTVEVLLDGKKLREETITASNLFTFNNKIVLTGEEITSGKHTLEVRRKGTGPVYFNAYLTNFTLEESIKAAGLEVKVNRKLYRLKRIEGATSLVSGSHGQAIDQKVEKYAREEIQDLGTLTSGELAEVELEIDSKNDYEYLLFEDMKAAGFEAVEVRSGYNGNDMGAYVEFRDDRVSFFVRQLGRGKHSTSYRLRAETPGKFSALPARASAMYAPELRANSDEIKVEILDVPAE